MFLKTEGKKTLVTGGNCTLPLGAWKICKVFHILVEARKSRKW